ncbi:hypothetical protein NDU88_001934 [Pleurodeles waltl]|uniref:Uncharacterized protein n=1 Tax=Pleurodeles waltl TaxID=8319 RepID=A0AAV7TJ67_PLEWA|nr:hypothetical protein NDU88_001934 [Pleurodeles waltl]
MEPPGHDKQSPVGTFLWPEDASSDTALDVRLKASKSEKARPMPKRESECGRREDEPRMPENQGPRGMSEQETERGVEERKAKTPTATMTPEGEPPREQFIRHKWGSRQSIRGVDPAPPPRTRRRCRNQMKTRPAACGGEERAGRGAAEAEGA